MIECLQFRRHQKGALQGFATIILTIAVRGQPVKFVQKGYKLWMKNGQRWVSLPQDKVEKNGDTDYVANCWLLDKDDKTTKDYFNKECVAAIDKWCKENAQQEDSPQAPEIKEHNDGFPF